MKVFRVAVIGCGVISETHLGALSALENTELVAACDIIPERAENAAKTYHCKPYIDYKKMIAEEKPDCVHICLPHYLHSVVSIYALEHGVDVLCEKPMDAHLCAARKMMRTAEKTGKRLGIISQNRYHAGAIFAKNIVENGNMGRLIGENGIVMWKRDDAYFANEWRGTYETAGGGVLINQAIHTLDLLRWLSGADVKSVKSKIGHLGSTHAEVEDTAAGLIKFENGVIANFYFTINSTFDRAPIIEMQFENGKVVIDGAKATAYYSDGRTESSEAAVIDEKSNPTAKECYGSTHIMQMRDFYSDPDGSRAKYMTEQAYKTSSLVHDILSYGGVEAK